MELDITAIKKDEFFSRLKFHFKKKQSRRNIHLNELLPIDGEISYCLFITNLVLKIGKQKYDVSDFDKLFKIVNLERNDENLGIIRQNYQIIENHHHFNSKLKTIIKDISGRSQWIYIHCAEDTKTSHYWRIGVDEFTNLEDFLNYLPVIFGEFDFFDESNNWYLKVWDDEPFIYLAAQDLVVRKLSENYTDKCIHVPKNFLYCK